MREGRAPLCSQRATPGMDRLPGASVLPITQSSLSFKLRMSRSAFASRRRPRPSRPARRRTRVRFSNRPSNRSRPRATWRSFSATVARRRRPGGRRCGLNSAAVACSPGPRAAPALSLAGVGVPLDLDPQRLSGCPLRTPPAPRPRVALMVAKMKGGRAGVDPATRKLRRDDCWRAAPNGDTGVTRNRGFVTPLCET